MSAVNYDQILIARTVDIPNQTERFDDWYEKRPKRQTTLDCRALGNIEAVQVGVQEKAWRVIKMEGPRSLGLVFSIVENLSRTFQKKPRQKRGF